MSTTFRAGLVPLSTVAALLTGMLLPAGAGAAPVIREATGANAAAIQAAVDAFRADLGNPNNGNTPGSQLTGRREINWDGGGAAANATTFTSPMTNFNTAPATRGAVFTTPGTGFEISGQPSPEFGDINATYPNIFAPFSSPRLFTPLGSNVLDVLFFVPGTNIPAAVTGFGAVFTDVDSASSTKLEFYGPNGELLLERFVLETSGSESLSFLGVSFDNGELVGRVRISSGNTALGPDETASSDIVVMDDFLYGEPVATQGLTISPFGPLFTTGAFDLVLALAAPAGATIIDGQATFDGLDVTADLARCLRPGTLVAGGQTFRCPGLSGGLLTTGTHVLNVRLDLSNGTSVRNAVIWDVVGNTEP